MYREDHAATEDTKTCAKKILFLHLSYFNLAPSCPAPPASIRSALSHSTNFSFFPKSSSRLPLDPQNHATPFYCIYRATVESSVFFFFKRRLRVSAPCACSSARISLVLISPFPHIFSQKLVGSSGVGFFPVLILCSLQILITLHNVMLICILETTNSIIKPCSHLLSNSLDVAFDKNLFFIFFLPDHTFILLSCYSVSLRMYLAFWYSLAKGPEIMAILRFYSFHCLARFIWLLAGSWYFAACAFSAQSCSETQRVCSRISKLTSFSLVELPGMQKSEAKIALDYHCLSTLLKMLSWVIKNRFHTSAFKNLTQF